jgi:fluoride exporter
MFGGAPLPRDARPEETAMADEQADELNEPPATTARPDAGVRRRAPSHPAQRDVLAAIAVGGVAGAEARYGIGVVLPHTSSERPWATLLINISGCFLIGVLMITITEFVEVHPLVRPCLGVGVLGGYTTFSTYAVDALSLARAGRTGIALAYLVSTPVLAVLACAAGAGVARLIGTAGAQPARRRPGKRR